MADTVHDILLSEIHETGSTQLRAQLEAWRVADLRAVYTNADEEVEPIVLFRDKGLGGGKKFWLADGHHRLAGCLNSGRKSIRAIIHEGNERAAILFAASVNSKQDKLGLPRTRDDKRKAVLTILKDREWGQRSSNWVAEACKVSTPFVEKLRQEPKGNVSSSGDESTGGRGTRTGRDGKQHPAGQGDTSEAATNGTGQKSTGKGGGKGKKGTKPGAEVIDWLKEFKDRFGPIVRWQDDLVRPGQGHPNEHSSSEYYAYGRLLKELLATAEKWWKKIKAAQKAKK